MSTVLRLFIFAVSASASLLPRTYGKLLNDLGTLGSNADLVRTASNNFNQSDEPTNRALAFSYYQLDFDGNITLTECRDTPTITGPQLQTALFNITNDFYPKLKAGLQASVAMKNRFCGSRVPGQGNAQQEYILSEMKRIKSNTNKLTGCLVSQACDHGTRVKSSATAISRSFNALLASATASFATPTPTTLCP